MATRAERARAKAERKGPNAKRAKKLAQRKPHHARGAVENKRAGRKASVAQETSNGKRPSRKSTRASANRGRSDTALVRRAENAASGPEARARRDAAKR